MNFSMQQKTLLQPQEIEVFYILPTLRREIAVAMKKNGLKQTKIAELLHIETATVSQYINKKRGNKIILDPLIKAEIKKSIPKITDKVSFIQETQRLLRLARQSGALCQIHRQLEDLPDHCTAETTCAFF